MSRTRVGVSACAMPNLDVVRDCYFLWNACGWDVHGNYRLDECGAPDCLVSVFSFFVDPQARRTIPRSFVDLVRGSSVDASGIHALSHCSIISHPFLPDSAPSFLLVESALF